MDISTALNSQVDADVVFEKLNENLAKVITMRDGKRFEVEMFIFSDKDYDEIVKIQAKIYKLRKKAEELRQLK